MAHFAELDENNIVKRVIVVNNEVLLDENNTESEGKGIDFCKSLYGEDTNWKQTSYNASFRKHYAAIGGYYDENKNIFIPPKPYSSWILNAETDLWNSPVPHPGPSRVGYIWVWSEENQNWLEINPLD